MKKVLILGIMALLVSVSITAPSCGSSAAKGPDTLKINTSELGADIIGYNGPTPVEVSVFQGVITDIKVLPNRETPRYLQMVTDSGLLKKLLGKNLEEAKQVQLDAVSGATYTSSALIKNVHLALDNIPTPEETK